MDTYLKELQYNFETTDYPIVEDLVNLIHTDFIDNNDCITLNDISPHKQNPLFKTPLEKCEWEYDKTHFHPDSFLVGDKEDEWEYLKAALECSKRLVIRLKATYPSKLFRVVISFSETTHDGQEVESYGSSTVRFYQIRPEAESVMYIDNLDNFQIEAVMEIEV